MPTIHVDFRNLLERGYLAVRRASAFMGMGITATSDLPASALVLEDYGITFLPRPVPDELAARLRQEFRTWVIGGALRELDSLYALFVDELYEACLLLAMHGGPPAADYNQRIKRMRDDTNMAGKLDRIRDEFGISSAFRDQIQTVSLARNALVHNAGCRNAPMCERRSVHPHLARLHHGGCG